MKLRFDLVEKITPEMLMESVLANNHRYKAEPLLSKTGTGSLSPASTEDRAIEEKLSTEITRKLMSASDNDGLDFLLECHRSAPFPFFNGNTFGEIARRVIDAIFIEFPPGRRREAASLGAHYVAGVLDRQSMDEGLSALAELADFKPGDRVETLRGSARGVVLRLQPDGRIVWQPDGTPSQLVALPESLLRERKGV